MPTFTSPQTTKLKHKHSSLQQRLSPSWRQDQRRLCSSQTPYQYCNHWHQETQKTTSYKIDTKYKQSEIKNNSCTSMDICNRHIPAYMETRWPTSWQRKEARSSSANQNQVTKKQKGSSETRG